MADGVGWGMAVSLVCFLEIGTLPVISLHNDIGTWNEFLFANSYSKFLEDRKIEAYRYSFQTT